MMVAKYCSQCDGRKSFPGRPPASSSTLAVVVVLVVLVQFFLRNTNPKPECFQLEVEHWHLTRTNDSDLLLVVVLVLLLTTSSTCSTTSGRKFSIRKEPQAEACFKFPLTGSYVGSKLQLETVRQIQC